MAALDGKSSRIEEAFAPVKSTIENLWSSLVRKDEPIDTKRLLFTATRAGAGTTTIATCAAIGLARHLMKDVLLVETNFYSPTLANKLELPNPLGFADLLRGEVAVEEIIRPTGVPGLEVIPAGTGQAPGFQGSARVQRALEVLAGRSEYLLLDGPPLLESAESRLLLPFVDQVIIVVRARKTEQVELKRAVRIVESSGAELLGTVLNQYKREAPGWLVPE
ncbi:MAG: CpsD/CapB family tyrosine-protein kinase [Planctomycetota bacterium]